MKTPTSSVSKLILCLGVPVLILAAIVVSSPAEGHAPDVELSGFGMSTIDGIFSPGEWDSAGSVDFLVNLPEGGTTPGTVFATNDADNLYLAIQFAATAQRNSASFAFDNNHLGGERDVTGDDALLINPEIGFTDQVFIVDEPPCSLGASCAFFDTTLGGTSDGAGAFSNAGGFTVYEFSHPLDSADDAHDFSLSQGDTVGFQLDIVMITSGSTAITPFPGPRFRTPSSYGDIVIAPVPEPSTMLLLGSGLAGLGFFRWRKKREA